MIPLYCEWCKLGLRQQPSGPLIHFPRRPQPSASFLLRQSSSDVPVGARRGARIEACTPAGGMVELDDPLPPALDLIQPWRCFLFIRHLE